MSDDFDGLLEPAPPKKKRGRPSKADIAAREAAKQAELAADATYQAQIRAAAAGNTLVAEREFHMPVGQNFLARVLNLDPMTCNRRLRRCKPVGYSGDKVKRPLYDFRTALEYLLKPKMDIETYLATLNPADMPPAINKALWEAKRIKLKFEVEAGQAWATEDVIAALGAAFMAIKTHTQLWVENIRGKLDPDTEKMLTAMVDAFQADLHAKLVDLPNQRQTRSRLAAVEKEMLQAQGVFDGEDEAAESEPDKESDCDF